MLWVRLKQYAAGGAETILSVALTLVFFLLFLGSITFIFPSGIVLRNAMSSSEIFGLNVASAASQHMLEGAVGAGVGGLAGNRLVAQLTVLKRDVKTKTANRVAWSAGRSGAPLRAGDAVQTARQGRALVTFKDAAEFRMGRNSLIVIREPEGRTGLVPPGPSLLVLEGELWVTSTGAGDRLSPIRVETPQGVARVASAGDGGPAEFKVTVGQDQSATISVYEGAAEVSAGERTVRVGASESVTIDSANVVLKPVRLPATPTPTAPAEGKIYRIREVPPRVRLDWKATEDADAYRVIIARDRDFQKVVVDDRVAEVFYSIGDLAAGTYHWRVTGINGVAEGPASRTSSFRIDRDNRPPELNVVYPAATINSDQCTITGSTEPGMRVFVAGESVVATDSGRFEHTIALDRGLNVIVIEAFDSAGNTAYSSKVIEANF